MKERRALSGGREHPCTMFWVVGLAVGALRSVLFMGNYLGVLFGEELDESDNQCALRQHEANHPHNEFGFYPAYFRPHFNP
uniref:Uncharacterized protein n=1 Tax=Candidatus Kentrum sp. FW TaxID=2126338 RepID=A0A450TP10_9GAMM|nr:MAG: hypothetical protein BECKFW1821B_GA0114236_11682 [Candidatus Kentron sp. FW]